MTSPTVAAQMAAVLAAFPGAKWVSWEPAGRDHARAGAVLAFGEPVEPQYRFDQADVVLSLEADFVSSHPASLRLVREFASRRKVSGERLEMNRLYVVEGSPTSTGAAADHRLALRSSEIEGFARAVAAGLGVAVEGGVEHPWASPIAKDLKRAGAKALVIAGESQPPAVHALAHAMNEALGAVGTTVTYTAPAEAAPVGETAALSALVGEMQSGAVEVLVVLGANPAYAAPADLKIAEALDKVPLRVHHGLYLDETAERCHWHLPASHGLESWGDLRAADGTVSIVQPLIAPLYNTLSEIEVLAAFGEGEPKGYDVLRAHWEAAARLARLREALEPRAPRRGRGRHRLRGEGSQGRPRRVVQGGEAGPREAASRSPSAPTPRSSTAASRTWAGCRSCRSRSRRSPGTTWPWSARRRPPPSAGSEPSRRRAATTPRWRS